MFYSIVKSTCFFDISVIIHKLQGGTGPVMEFDGRMRKGWILLQPTVFILFEKVLVIHIQFNS